MKIAIIGYGKMGKAIEETALLAGDEIVARIDSEEEWKTQTSYLKLADVAVEFSSNSAVVANIYKCFEINLPVVTGTTAWEDRLEEVRNKCISLDQTLFVAPNYSLGVNLFFKLNRFLSKLMNQFPQYEVEVKETHHTQKLDKPSGTAVTLASDIITNLERKNTWVNSKTREPVKIQILSYREGNIAGIHEIKYTSPEDAIMINHTAYNRKGFAKGALMAANWIIGKKGFFTMDDMFSDILKP